MNECEKKRGETELHLCAIGYILGGVKQQKIIYSLFNVEINYKFWYK